MRMATPPDKRWSRLSIVIMVAGVSALLAAGALTLFALTQEECCSDVGTATTFGTGLDSSLLTPQPSPTAPLPTPVDAPIARIAIPKFEVDAPVVIRGVDANRVMETPDGPVDVAWYDFSERPGYGSNAVFSGHVDYINYGPAVFWHLKDLVEGDTIEVRLTEGTVYTYRVVSRSQVAAEPTQEELAQIVGETPTEVVTLITCGGTFDGHQYDQRTIVRAERVYDTTAPAADAAPAP